MKKTSLMPAERSNKLSPRSCSRRRRRTRPALQIPPSVAIAFVEELQKAHQVFQFRDYLRTSCPFIKHDSSLEAIFDLFLSGDLLKHMFYLADDQDIKHAIKLYISELNAKRSGQVVPQRNNAYAFKNPIYYLVFQAREESYLFHEDLLSELNKLKKFTPMFYRDCLVYREPPVEVEARTVTFRNFSPDVSWIDIRNFFNCCGRVENVEMESTSQGKIAHVTFKDLSGSSHAQSYSGAVLPSLSKRSIQNRSRYTPVLVQPKSVEAVTSAYSDVKKAKDVAADVSSKYAEAHKKYNELRTYYCDIQAKHVKNYKKEESWGGCQWMGLEAMANGGFTIGGQRVGKVLGQSRDTV